MLWDRKLPKVPGIFVEGEPMSLVEAKLQMRQLLTARYPLNGKELPTTAPEEVVSTDFLASHLAGGAGSNLCRFDETTRL